MALLGQRQKFGSAKDALTDSPGPGFPFSKAGVVAGKLGKLLLGGLLTMIISLTKLWFFVFSTLNKSVRKCNCKY
jgi:hypothetical protein